MDRITESMVEAFANSFGIANTDKDFRFEQFANYCVVNNVYGTAAFELEDITTGDSTQGMDGIAIIVNQKLVNNTDDIDLLISVNQNISVKFVIIQAKTSDRFSNSEIGNMMTFTKRFFSGNTGIFATDEMKKFLEIKEYIFENGDKLKKNPELELYYVTSGIWTNDTNLLVPVEDGKTELVNTNLFSSVTFYPCGAREIQDLYRKTKDPLKASFKFEKRVTMYTEADEEFGICGVLPFSEYRKLILDDNGNPKPVFEDNIRDYLGLSQAVNKSIKQSIQTGDRNAFCMLNNGITIVANSLRISGDTATIEDYQIVNGCQTSNVLISCIGDRTNIDELIIPVRIIATNDEELKNKITKATNSQTSIKQEQLEALSSFQKSLEEYYKTYNQDDSLVYERRTGQYRDGSIPKSRIITIPTQIKTMAAMFLNEPSAVSGQYGTIAKRIGGKIFRSTDKHIMYYASALALNKIEYLFRNGTLDKKYRRCRYHAIMLLRIVSSADEMPRFNSKKMVDYCNRILNILNNDSKCKDMFTKIVEFIVTQNGLNTDDRKCFERKETTEILLKNEQKLREILEK